MKPLSEWSDDDLLRRSSSGEEEAFAALYRRRQGAVYRFALQMSGSAAVAEEVTQEVFLAVICGAAGYDPSRGTLVSWLFGVTRHHVLRHARRDWRYLPIEESVDEPAPEQNALDTLARGETLESVRQAVLALPEHYREAVVLCDLEELSYEDAAQALECAVGTVRSRLHRGRALLAGKLRRRMGCPA